MLAFLRYYDPVDDSRINLMIEQVSCTLTLNERSVLPNSPPFHTRPLWSNGDEGTKRKIWRDVKTSKWNPASISMSSSEVYVRGVYNGHVVVIDWIPVNLCFRMVSTFSSPWLHKECQCHRLIPVILSVEPSNFGRTTLHLIPHGHEVLRTINQRTVLASVVDSPIHINGVVRTQLPQGSPKVWSEESSSIPASYFALFGGVPAADFGLHIHDLVGLMST